MHCGRMLGPFVPTLQMFRGTAPTSGPAAAPARKLARQAVGAPCNRPASSALALASAPYYLLSLTQQQNAGV